MSRPPHPRNPDGPLPYRLALLLLAAALLGCADEPADLTASYAVADAMGGDTTGYARADVVRPFSFPADHGPHPDFKTEWWYYTGNVDTPSGRAFGYQFTLFRVALAPPADTVARASGWAARQLYMGHLAVTDVAGGRFYAFERLSRGAQGLAGATARPFRVWLEDWSTDAAAEPAGPIPYLRVRAEEDGTGIDLRLRPAKPLVLQGDRGLDPKGAGAGNASYYYSYTRLATEGTVTVDGEAHPVSGWSWMDREWSTSALDEGMVGWDWFALQLSDGRDLMYYQLRQADGTPSPYTSGVLVGPDGAATPLGADDATLDVLDTWTSPGGPVYPARWRLRVPAAGLDLTITPVLADQELDVSVRYWEGAVRIDGTAGEASVTGRGYVELTGYGEGPAARI